MDSELFLCDNKRDNLKNQDITLCSVVENTKLAHYSKTVISAEETIKDFGKKQYEEKIIAYTKKAMEQKK